MNADRRIAGVDEVPAEGSLLVTCEDADGDDREVIVMLTGEGTANGDRVVAWRNHCQHWTDVRLDRGDGVTRRNGELVCGKHGAMFEVDSGVCTYGPCEGAVLDAVAVEVRDGDVYLAEAGWSFSHLGPCEARDRSSRGGIGFS